MALDKQFLKYKLEKVKNDRMDKNMDYPARVYQREYNARLAQDEAGAIHSYLGAEDTEPNDNSSITTADVFLPYDDQAAAEGIRPATTSEKVPIKDYVNWALDGKTNVGDSIKNGVTKSFITKTYRIMRGGGGGYQINERYAKVTVTNGIVTDISTINMTGNTGQQHNWGY